ncbi:MAG TPA: proline dehydrogenase [Candidatus Marinimicrobia bacterium]|jgi:proline dehydrogenase|nr:proline dehydrogenase [Candidatus Neomarinimicrobiota bacterium]HIB27542.1 proline dehydrogenase [Candidatus Neomarinimicrobiota bacterium]
MNLLNPIIKATLPLVPKPIVRRIAKPYIAGETLPELVSVVQELNHDRFIVATSILGEFVTEVKDAEEAVQQYQEVLTEIKDLKLESNIHIKLSHFGLKLDKEVCYNNLINILKTAADCGNFVRIDMEDSTCTDDTLAIYKRAREKFENVGVVIQACMKRSNEDIDSLKAMKANVRICKGIYIEPPEIAYNDREIVRQNYSTLLKDLLGAGCYVGIATHDKWLVDDAFQTIEELALDHSQYEFQMLYGVDPQLRQMIRDAGHRMRVAVPFGPSWYPYSIRRLRKNPTVARYVLQALFKK